MSHLPHARPGEGRGRRPRAGAAGAGRDARSSGAPTPSASAAPRRSSSSAGSTAARRAGSRSWRPAWSTPSSRPATSGARAAPSASLRPAGAAVRRAHPAAEGRRRRRAGTRPPSTGPTPCSSSSAGPAALDGEPRSRSCARWSTSSASPTGCASCRPQPHHLLSSYYRAADVVLVPSRSESFGLVALEAAACGTPVVAAAVGGLLTLVDHGHTGFLGRGPRPRGLRRLHRRAARRTSAWPGRWASARGGAPRATPGRWRRLGCGGSTPTSPWAACVDCSLSGLGSMSDLSTTARSTASRRRSTAGCPRRRRQPGHRRGRSRRPGCRGAGTCGCGARRRTSPRSGSRSASGRCGTRRT